MTQIQNKNRTPEEFILDPTMSNFLLLDQISRRTGKSLDAQIEIIRLLQQTLSTNSILNSILKELQDEADEGAVLRSRGTVTPTQFVIIDTNRDPGHSVKGYTVRNDGPNTIFVAHNAAFSSQVDADIIDIVSNDSRFEQILPDEDIRFSFNRRRIKNIHILSSGGNSQFRTWLVW